MTLRLADRAPVAVGLKVTVIVHVPPAGSGVVVLHVVVLLKSPVFVPVKLIPVNDNEDPPVLVSVMVCGVLLVPTLTVPKFKVPGES
jgi:hypothetical protein